MKRSAILAALWMLAAPVASALNFFDAGPFASRLPDARGQTRLRAAGPIYERAHLTGDRELKAVRPFYSRLTEPHADREYREFLWPVAFTKQFRNDLHWRVLQTWGTDFDVTERSRYRVWSLPFYYQGRDAQGEFYLALWPLGGTIHEFLGRDRIAFLLWPLWIRSQVNDVVTTDILWPIFSRTTSEGQVHRFRVFPLYGESHRRAEYHKRFILWPIYNWVRYDYDGSRGTGFILFPLYGRMALEDQDTWWVIPPFFRYSRSDEQRLVYAPWPFLQWGRGHVDKLWVWPLWGTTRRGPVTRWFALWPFIHKTTVDRPAETIREFKILPFVHSASERSKEQDAREEARSKYLKIWPLYDYERVGDSSAIQMLALWPARDTPRIDRNWKPFWTLYERSRFLDRTECRIFWGLYRDAKTGQDQRRASLFPLWDYQRGIEDDPERLRWSFLKGLVGFERTGTNRTVRLLYFFKL
jgi:hypothetical protein